nr:immunoglobulin heavy chain junction region [Mus musculus]
CTRFGYYYAMDYW